MSGTYEFIIYEKADRVAWITLNRPEAMNAQSDGLRMELVDALEQASEDDEVFVVVITGSGDKAFSAGADVAQYVTRVPSYVVSQKYILRPFELIRNMTKPVVACVNGLALGRRLRADDLLRHHHRRRRRQDRPDRGARGSHPRGRRHPGAAPPRRREEGQGAHLHRPHDHRPPKP